MLKELVLVVDQESDQYEYDVNSKVPVEEPFFALKSVCRQ